MAHTPKNPYAAVWAEAERRLRAQIDALHELGVHTDRARRDLNWQGASERRFQTRARLRHDELHQHNDLLRALLRLVIAAGDVPMPAPAPAPKPATPTSGGLPAQAVSA